MTTAGEILFADTNVFLSATDRSRRLEENALHLDRGVPSCRE